MRPGKLFCQAIDVVEVAVRLVLVLLVELIVVEAFVVEFRKGRRWRLWSTQRNIAIAGQRCASIRAVEDCIESAM